jgi:hypothetical protein
MEFLAVETVQEPFYRIISLYAFSRVVIADFHLNGKVYFLLTQQTETEPSQRDRTIAFLRNLNMVFLLLTS